MFDWVLNTTKLYQVLVGKLIVEKKIETVINLIWRRQEKKLL